MKNVFFSTALLVVTLSSASVFAENGYFNTKQGKDVA